MRSTTLGALALVLLFGTGATFGPAELQDSVQVFQVGDGLVAVSGQSGSTSRLRLRVHEYVRWISNRGLVAVALTNERLLAVRAGGGGFIEQPLRVEERRALPPARDLLLDDRSAIVVMPARLLGFGSEGGGWQELQLTPHEAVGARVIDEAVSAVVTNRRAIGFTPQLGFATISLALRERAPQISTEDRSVTLVTPLRVLVFTQATGRWSAISRTLRF